MILKVPVVPGATPHIPSEPEGSGTVKVIGVLLQLSTVGIEFRLHDTTLYNSIYRADSQLLVNTHLYGFTATQSPVLHLHGAADGSMVTTYLDSFERVWATAVPLE